MKRHRIGLDDDVVRLLRDEPELIAIALAFVETQRVSESKRWLRAAVTWPAAVAVVAGISLVFVLAQSRQSFLASAQAAIGDQPVLHVVVGQPMTPLVDTATGAVMNRTKRTEIWFDQSAGLEKSETTIDGEPLESTLVAQTGGWTSSGPVMTCEWIAAHPSEARAARVRCDSSSPSAPEPPTLDRALAGFADRYQAELATGELHPVSGSASVNGRDVRWYEFNPVSTAAGPLIERVAIDKVTHKPLEIRYEDPVGDLTSYSVDTAETVPFDASLFSKPIVVPTPSSRTVAAAEPIALSEAADLMSGKLVRLGVSDEELRGIEHVVGNMVVTSAPGVMANVETAAVELDYASPGDTANRPDFKVFEATSCNMAFGWTCTAADPQQDGTMSMYDMIALVKLDGLYVSIWATDPAGAPKLSSSRSHSVRAGRRNRGVRTGTGARSRPAR